MCVEEYAPKTGGYSSMSFPYYVLFGAKGSKKNRVSGLEVLVSLSVFSIRRRLFEQVAVGAWIWGLGSRGQRLGFGVSFGLELMGST